MKLKKGDRVQVIQGKDIGKTGEVAFVFPERNKVIVESSEGINVAKKHQKPTGPRCRAASRTRRCRSTCRT